MTFCEKKHNTLYIKFMYEMHVKQEIKNANVRTIN
jgi:hypothetical protein